MPDDPKRFQEFKGVPVRCGLCVFWGDTEDQGQRFRKCGAVKQGAVRFDDDFNETIVASGEQYDANAAPLDYAYVVDGSGYFAALKTEQDFGCALFTLPAPHSDPRLTHA